MNGRQTIVRVSRQYDQWVSDRTLQETEDSNGDCGAFITRRFLARKCKLKRLVANLEGLQPNV